MCRRVGKVELIQDVCRSLVEQSRKRAERISERMRVGGDFVKKEKKKTKRLCGMRKMRHMDKP